MKKIKIQRSSQMSQSLGGVIVLLGNPYCNVAQPTKTQDQVPRDYPDAWSPQLALSTDSHGHLKIAQCRPDSIFISDGAW